MRGTLLLSILFIFGAWPAEAQQGDEPVRATDLVNLRQIGDVRVSPDGRQVVYAVRSVVSEGDAPWDSLSVRTHLYVADAVAWSAPRQLTQGDQSASDPAWSPDGERLAFVRTVDETPQVFVLPMLGGEAFQATDLEHGASSPRWSPDGSRLLVASSIPHADLRDRLGAPPWPSERPGRSDDASPASSAAPDGSLGDIRAWLDRNADEGNPRVFTRLDLQGEHELEPALSYRHLFVVEVDTTTAPSMITQGYADFSSGAWLPDGDRIVAAGLVYGTFHPDRTRGRNLYLVTSDGGRIDPLLELPGLALDDPAVSPAGRVVAFTARDMSDLGYAQTKLGLFEVDDPAAARFLTDSLDRSVSAPVWSPDGWFLYFTAASNGGVPLYRMHPFERDAATEADTLAETADDEPAADTTSDGADEAPGAADATSDENGEADTTSDEPGEAEAPEAAVASSLEIERLSSFDRGILSFDVGRSTVFFAATEVANPYELYASNLSLDNERRLTNHNAEWIQAKRLSFPERRVLTRDALQIEYWVMQPAFFEADRQYPLLLQIHGGPMAMWGPGEATMWHELQFFASQGYGIVFANPRGSGGYGYDFQRANYRDWGTGPMGDVLAAANEADDLPWVDSTRQVVTGGSYAGYLTAWIAAHDDRFRAAVAQRGVYDLGTFLGEGNAWRLVSTHFGGYPWEGTAADAEVDPTETAVADATQTDTTTEEIATPDAPEANLTDADTDATPADTTVADITTADTTFTVTTTAPTETDTTQTTVLIEAPAEVLARSSPLAYVERIRTPLLIMHADNDLRTGVAQSEMLYKSLKILGRPVEYVRYPDAGHDLSRTGDPKQRIDRMLRIYEFFERFIR